MDLQETEAKWQANLATAVVKHKDRETSPTLEMQEHLRQLMIGPPKRRNKLREPNFSVNNANMVAAILKVPEKLKWLHRARTWEPPSIREVNNPILIRIKTYSLLNMTLNSTGKIIMNI